MPHYQPNFLQKISLKTTKHRNWLKKNTNSSGRFYTGHTATVPARQLQYRLSGAIFKCCSRQGQEKMV